MELIQDRLGWYTEGTLSKIRAMFKSEFEEPTTKKDIAVFGDIEEEDDEEILEEDDEEEDIVEGEVMDVHEDMETRMKVDALMRNYREVVGLQTEDDADDFFNFDG